MLDSEKSELENIIDTLISQGGQSLEQRPTNFSRNDDLTSVDNQKMASQLFKHREDKHRLAVRYFRIIIWFIIIYILCILCIVCLVGKGCLDYDQSVIGVFLGTTSVHIIGLGYIVTRWLFPNIIKDS